MHLSEADARGFIAVSISTDALPRSARHNSLAVRQQTKVRQRLLGGAALALSSRKQVAEVNQELAVAKATAVGEHEDARQVVVERRLLLLRKVPVVECCWSWRYVRELAHKRGRQIASKI